MTFLPIDKLQVGMMLDRDVYLYGSKASEVLMLKAGRVLTESYINQLYELEIPGVYIHSSEKKEIIIKAPAPVNQELKQEAVTSIEQVFGMFYQSSNNISINNISKTMSVSKKLVNALKNNVEAKLSIENLKLYDDYTYNHSLGVSMLSIAIGLSLGLKTNDLYELGLCALLHDVGKVAVPIDIIAKPAKLTYDEFEIVKQHPAKGAEFFLKHNLTSPKICAGILTHHEKYDGSGYPNGLRGEEIPLFGRIISIADVYDALTSVRPYRQPSSPSEAIEYIMGFSGKAFDIMIVKAFLRKVAPYPIGACVKLSNEQIAIIVKQNESQPLRPFIRLINQPDDILDLFRRRDLQNIVIDNICKISTTEL